MNIQHIIAGCEELEHAFTATINPADRRRVKDAIDICNLLLRRHGLFRGSSTRLDEFPDRSRTLGAAQSMLIVLTKKASECPMCGGKGIMRTAAQVPSTIPCPRCGWIVELVKAATPLKEDEE